MKPNFFIAILIAFCALTQASGQQNLDYCEVNQPCTLGDFVFNDTFQLETSECCNASIWFPNGTSLIENATMTANSNGFHNYTFNAIETTGFYAGRLDCFCSNSLGRKNANFLAVNSSEININLSGINITASGITAEQNATLYQALIFSNSSKAETQCYVAGHSEELQGNNSQNNLANIIILILLLGIGTALTIFGTIKNIPALGATGGLILMFAGLWILTQGVTMISGHDRVYSCDYGVDANGQKTLLNTTITTQITTTSAANALIVEGLGLVILMLGLTVLVMQAIAFTKRGEENEDYEV